MKLKTLFATLMMSSTLVALPALAEDAPVEKNQRSEEAMAILKKADAAIKKVQGIRFQSTVEPTGLATNFVSYAEGGGHMTGFNGQTPERFYGKVTTSRPGSDEKIKVEGGGDGETFFLIDHSTKKGYEDMDPAVMGSTGQLLQGIGMIEYVHNAPFDDELGAEIVELAGDGKIGNEDCHKVRVVYAGGAGESTWSFSKKDYLPRQRIRHFKSPQGEGAITITLNQVELDPKVDPGDYKMKLPEGYEQIDDFAP